ncbi:hypothetical protein [Blastochloris tepida]|uniref:Antitoxin SocA-like Panacea domain-containing protein n=1 Tax=Blastochloris tepida TaxID=2233851 RepID=A0A348FXW1_9HYPH|nr:hypothetical protein [Blastochloris tepida]BBF92144.1 hypothetical protein BLTE_08290 [Blastochloris tepida]
MATREQHLAAVRIVQDADGELVGRTRLQKIAFLLKLAGFESQFSFEYRHYGPYSEDLAQAMEIAAALGTVLEDERIADWGGRYSIYTLGKNVAPRDPVRSAFVQKAKRVNAVELELAATAAYLFVGEGIGGTAGGNPWHETRRRKPSKAAGGRLERAARVYEELRQSETVYPLPELPPP